MRKRANRQIDDDEFHQQLDESEGDMSYLFKQETFQSMLNHDFYDDLHFDRYRFNIRSNFEKKKR